MWRASTILYVCILGALTIVVSGLSSKTQRERRFIVFAAPAAYILRVVLIYLNETFYLLQPKKAGDRTLVLYEFAAESGLESALTDTFFVQLLVNYPAFTLVGNVRPVHLLTNAAIGALVAVVVFFYMARIFCQRAGMVAFGLFAIYPTFLNFSIFGLRDILILFAIALFVLASLRLRLSNGSQMGQWMWILFSFCAIYSLRAELLVVCFLCLIPVSSLEKVGTFLFRRPLSRRIAVYAAMLLILPLLVQGYRITAEEFGYRGYVAPNQLVQTYAEKRYMASTGPDGGGSDILGPDRYATVSTPYRVALQVTGMFLIPLPHVVSEPTHVISFLVSTFVLFCLFIVLKRIWGMFKSGTNIPIPYQYALVFIVSLVLMGLIVSNSGNAFRLRMPILSLLFIPFTYRIVYG